jgi:hypothetical protein
LEAVLELWPRDTVPWSWFLGPRLIGLDRREAETRVALALLIAQSRRGVTLPFRGRIRSWFARATMAQWVNGVQLLAAYLDASECDLEEARAQLVAALRQPMPRQPPDQAETVPGWGL